MGRASIGLGWIALIASAACGDGSSSNPPAAGGIRDGSRLEARYWDAGDGARVLRVWFDRAQGIECAFQRSPDERYRCLPTGETVASLSNEFADAACTQPIVTWPSCAPPPTAILSAGEPTPSCPADFARSVFEVGAESTTLFLGTDTGCSPWALTPDQRAFHVGTERPANEFVGADLVVQDSARLAPFTFQADDGAVEIVSIWDTERDAECAPSGPFSDEKTRCGPVEIALHHDFLWSDDTCTVHAAADLSPFRPCFPPTAVVGDGEPFGSNLLEIGARIPDGQAHRTDDTGMCTPETTGSVDGFYLEGPPIPLEALAELTSVVEGTGRVRAALYAPPGDEPLARAGSFRDTTLDTDCYPARFADGFRCVPSGALELGGAFADADCTSPLVPTAAPPSLIPSRHTATDACDFVAFDGAFEAGTPFDGTEIFVLDGSGACVASPVSPDLIYYAPGAPLDLALIETP